MPYLEYLDCETVDSTNKVLRFSHENQSQVKQGVTHRLARCQMITLRQIHTLSVT